MDEESGAVRIHCYVQECKKAPIKSEANVVRRTDGRMMNMDLLLSQITNLRPKLYIVMTSRMDEWIEKPNYW